jgi:hypothetical protein
MLHSEVPPFRKLQEDPVFMMNPANLYNINKNNMA